MAPRPLPIYTYDYISQGNELTSRDHRRLAFAAKVAAPSDHDMRMGAVIVSSGRVISHSCNIAVEGKLSLPYRRSVHAEICALRKTKVRSILDGSTLYVARLDSQDRYAMAKPCVYCLDVAINYGVERFVFSTGPSSFDSFRYDMISDYTLPSPYTLKELSWN